MENDAFYLHQISDRLADKLDGGNSTHWSCTHTDYSNNAKLVEICQTHSLNLTVSLFKAYGVRSE